MSLAKFKQVLLYLGLTFSFLLASVGVSNADPVDFDFTVTAEVGCDASDPAEDIPGSLDNVTVASGSSLNLGEVDQGSRVSIDFEIDATDPTDCEGGWLGSDQIDISYSDDSVFSDEGCYTDDSLCAIDVFVPLVTGPMSETITFSHTP